MILDVKNAFNSAKWNGIIREIKSRQITVELTSVVQSDLSDIWLSVDGQWMEIAAGLPHESVLGPVLWTILYDEVLKLDMPEGVTIICR